MPEVPAWLVTAAGWSWRLMVVAAAVTAAILLLARLYFAVLPVIIALVLSTVLVPPATWLRERRVPRALSAVMVFGGALAFVGLLAAVIVPQTARELDNAVEVLEEGWDDTLDWLETGPLGITREAVDDVIDRGMEQARLRAAQIATGILAGAAVVVQLVAGALLSLVVLFFITKDGDRIVAWLVARTPPHQRADLRAAAQRAWWTLGRYLAGTAVVAAVDAVGIGLGLVILRVPLVLPLVLLTFFGGFFPIVGATLAGLVAVLVGLVSGGVVTALLVLAVVVAVQQLEGNVLEPVVLSKAVPLHPIVILFALSAGGVLGGLIGAFLAVPAAAVVSAVGNELRLRHEGRRLHTELDGGRRDADHAEELPVSPQQQLDS